MIALRVHGQVSKCSRHGASRRWDRAASAIFRIALSALVLFHGTWLATAQTLPTGGRVVGGQAVIGTPSAAGLNVTQSSQRAVIDWNAFSIGAGQAVTFQQPGSGAALLNRVTGDTPSSIAGSLNANGQIYLLNPNGIAITSSGAVATGAFVGSTLDIHNDDFMAGRMKFTGSGQSASVSNAGRITTRSGGYVALLGGTVENSGIITSELGRVALGSGESATLDLEGDGFLQVAIPSVGKAGRTLVENSGSIAARGGRVELRAATAREAVRNVVNMPGSISASSVSSRNGVVVIDGGEGARVQVSGRVSARGRDVAGGSIKISGDQLALDKARIRAGSKTATGGSIELTGRDIGLRSATLDASGATGGGKIRIGGDFYGRGAIKPAETTTIENSDISANSTSSGDAGSVVVWADGTTRFSGVITARALGSSGNGGKAEVSGKAMLVYDGTTDLRAYNGRTGTLLLDPYNVTINTAATTGGFTASADNTIINVTTLQNALATANVEISTGTSGTQAGNILVSNAVTWSSGNLLTLTAAGTITINGSLNSTGGGGINLNAGANIGIGSGVALNVGAGAGSGVWLQAAGNITIATGTSITTQGHDVTLASDRDGSGSGSITISGTAIDTNGGSATFSGGSGTLSELRTTGYAEGFGSTSRAIDFRNSQLNTGSGSIWMRGRGGDTAGTNSYGVWLGNNATVTSTTGGIYFDGVAIGTATNTYHNGVLIGVASVASAGGEIVVTGRGGNTTSDGQSGVTLSSGYITNSGAGTITVNATSPTVAVAGTSYALRLTANSEIRSSGAGTITLNTVRNAGAVGFYLENSHVGLGTLAGAYTGNLAINSDTFVLAGASSLKGSGGLSLAPVTASSTIAIGGTGTSTLDLTSAELAMIQPGFSSITIGSASGTGTVDVRSWSANAPLAIRGGAIALNGSLASTGDVTLTGSSYALNTATVQATSLGFGNANPVTLTGAANLNLSGASTVLNVFSGSGSLTKLGAGTLALAGANTYAGGTTISAGTLQIGNGGTTGSLAPGAIVNNGTLAFSRSDAIAISHQVTGSGLITATTGGVTVNGDWTVGSIALATTAGGSITLAAAMSASNVALSAAGSVIESGGGTITAAALSASAGANITLAAASNSIGVFAASAAGSISLNQAGALTIGTSGGIAGVTANGEIAIRSTGAMAIQQAVSTSDTGVNALLLVAGDGTAAGLSTGGDISASGAASISVGAGGLARLYTGSVSGSATAALLGTAGGYRYGSNLTSQAYGRALGAGVNLIYREQPVLGVTLDTGGSLTRVYDGSTTTALVNLTNAANGDSFSPVNVGSAKNAGSYTFDTASVTNDLGYAIASGSWQYDITRRAATITIQAQTRAYGDVNPALTYTTQNVVAGDVFPGELATTATVTSNVAAYAITAGTVASSNYDLTFQGANLSVTPRALSVVADAKTRVYGDANPALTYMQTGLVNGDTLQGALATSAGAASNVGVYAITQGDLVASSNYALTYTGADLTLTRRALSVVADAKTRVYGAANPALTYVQTGLVNGDALQGGLATSAGLTSNVGAYDIEQGDLAASNNYTLTYAGANLQVTPRTLAITVDAKSRIYGDLNPALTYQQTGLVNGDLISGGLITSAVERSNVGSYAIARGDLAASSNYAIDFTGAALSITQRAATLAAHAQSRGYGDANPALTYTAGGLLPGDTLTASLTTSTSPTSNVGAYAIALGSVNLSPNYSLTYTGANLSVTPRALSVVADAKTRIYGDANPALTYMQTGLVNGDTLQGAFATSAGAASNIGVYAITQGDLVASSNYALTYTGADLTLTRRALSVVVDAKTRVYGDANPALTYVQTGLVNGDALQGGLATSAGLTSNVGAYAIEQGDLVASSNYTLTYAGANLQVTPRTLAITADAKSRIYGDVNPALTYQQTGLVNGDLISGGLITSAVERSNVGSYAIARGDLAASSNYAIDFTGAALSITQRAATLAAHAQSRSYGDANPALTYTAGGLLSGDTLTASLTTSASPTSNVGAYAIALGSVNLSPNYSLTYTGANLIITPRALSVVADAKTRVYGDANPALTYMQTGLVNGDTLQGALATGAMSTSGLGDYAIARGSLASSGNYSMTYMGAGLSVTPRALTITAESQSKMFGSVFTFTGREFKTQGLVNGDRVDAVSLSSLGAPATAPGESDGAPKTYAIDIADPTGVGLGKYTVTLVGSLLTVQMLTTVDWASAVTPVSQVSAATSMPFGGPPATVIEWDKSLEPAQDWMPLRLRRLDDEGQGRR